MQARYLKRLEAFSKFIDSLDLNDDEKRYIIANLYSKESITKMHSNNYLPDEQSIQQFENFINYLYEKNEELGTQYIRDAINYALTYKNDDNNFLDQFIKFIVVTNFDEIVISDTINPSNQESMKVQLHFIRK